MTAGTGVRPAPASVPPEKAASRTARRWTGLAVGLALLALAVALSIAVGSRTIGLSTVWHVLWHDDGTPESVIVHQIE